MFTEDRKKRKSRKNLRGKKEVLCEEEKTEEEDTERGFAAGLQRKYGLQKKQRLVDGAKFYLHPCSPFPLFT